MSIKSKREKRATQQMNDNFYFSLLLFSETTSQVFETMMIGLLIVKPVLPASPLMEIRN